MNSRRKINIYHTQPGVVNKFIEDYISKHFTIIIRFIFNKNFHFSITDNSLAGLHKVLFQWYHKLLSFSAENNSFSSILPGNNDNPKSTPVADLTIANSAAARSTTKATFSIMGNGVNRRCRYTFFQT